MVTHKHKGYLFQQKHALNTPKATLQPEPGYFCVNFTFLIDFLYLSFNYFNKFEQNFSF